MLIDWKIIALNTYDKIKAIVSTMKKPPTLGVILVWDNSSSLRYINQKKKWAEYTWINFNLIKLEEDIKEELLLDIIKKFNNDKKIHGFIVQLPLPKHINEQNILKSITHEKDVDWFHPINQWKLVLWDKTWFTPCTPAWIIEILKYKEIPLLWKVICIVGRSNIVWKPLANLLINAWATVIVCNSKTLYLSNHTKKADIIIMATWNPWLLKLDMIKKRSLIIDVWFTVIDNKIYWDAETEKISDAGYDITPVPGWVWPLTVAMLMKNTLKASKNFSKKY